MVSYQEAMNTADAKSKLTGGVQFFFEDQKTPGVARTIGEWVANKKTNATNKTDEEACNWAFLSAMISLQQRALREGGDAVINIHSFYKKIAKKGTQQFECGAGAFVAGVTLKGTVVKLK
jgi:uncharacterized protein YbjQ (UPF0145 family)